MKGKKSKKPFYSEYMIKHWPKPPRCICRNKINRDLGIVSPTLEMYTALGGKGKQATDDLKEYRVFSLKYLCYKRKLSKAQWKALYRIHRNSFK